MAGAAGRHGGFCSRLPGAEARGAHGYLNMAAVAAAALGQGCMGGEDEMGSSLSKLCPLSGMGWDALSNFTLLLAASLCTSL
jgi:hypothetical protein